MSLVLTDDVNEMKAKRGELIEAARKDHEDNKDWTVEKHRNRIADIKKVSDHVKKLEQEAEVKADFESFGGSLLESGAGHDGSYLPGSPEDIKAQFPEYHSVKFRTGCANMRMGRPEDMRSFSVPKNQRKANSVIGRRAFRDYCHGFKTPEFDQSQPFENLMQWGGDHGEHHITAPMTFHSEFLKGCDQVSIMRQLATVIPMSKIGDLGIRKRTKKTSSFAWGCACAKPTADEPGLGLRTMSLHNASFASCVCRDLLRRVDGFDVEGYIADELARDAGEEKEKAFIMGDGVKKPLGIFTADNSGISTARDVDSGVVGGVESDDFIRLKMHLCVSCRQGPSGGRLSWILPTDMLTATMLMKDGNGQYLWRPGLAQDFPDTLLGHRVLETNVFVADISAGNYVAMIGDFSRYWILDGPSLGLERDIEAFDDQVCWIGRDYTDGMPIEEDCFARLKVKS